MNIEYRDASYFEGLYGRKRVHRIEAVLGNIRAFGKNKTEAKANLEEQIASLCEHAYDRRYLTGIAYDGRPVTFMLYYCDGWGYDIIRPRDDSEHPTVSGTIFNVDTDYREAYERMKNHFEQYTEQAA